MKKILIAILMFCATYASGQSIGRFRYDSTVFERLGGFNKVRIIGNLAVTNLAATADTTYKPLGISSTGIINKLTYWPGSGGGGGSTNTNLGAGYRWAVPNTNGIKTSFYGLGLLADSTTNANGITSYVDTSSSSILSRQRAALTYQPLLSLTTTGSSGAATLVGATLNIPQYAGGSQGLQSVITQDPVLTLDNTIDNTMHDLTFSIDNALTSYFRLSGTDPTLNKVSAFLQRDTSLNTLLEVYARGTELTTNYLLGFSDGGGAGLTTLVNVADDVSISDLSGTTVSMQISGDIGGSQSSGYRLTPYFFSTANVGVWAGFHSYVPTFAAGSVIATYEGISLDALDNSGTIGTAYGLYNGGQSAGTGTIQNNYGIYLEDISGGSTDNYSIYTKAGRVRLGGDTLSLPNLPGNATPNSVLTNVNGDGNATWEPAGGGGSGSPNTNLGAGYRLAVPNTNGIKTLFAGTNITLDSAANANGITINSTGGGGSGAQYVNAPYNIVNDSLKRRFNVRDFGATGDSTQDATVYIQAAIDSAFNFGGGEVFFPNGYYYISGPLITLKNGINLNTQIVIPPSTLYPGKRSHVTLKGETAPNFSPGLRDLEFGYNRAGVVLKSTINGSGTFPSVFGGKNATGFMYHYVSFENITLLTKANAGTSGPQLTAIDGTGWASVILDNCFISIDTSFQVDTLPQYQVAGVITSFNGGETMSRISNTLINGYRYGLVSGDHVYLDNAQVWNCYAGFVFGPSGHPAYGTKILSHLNKYDIFVPDTTIMGITPSAARFTIASVAIEQIENTTYPTAWNINVANVYDPGGWAQGNITYRQSFAGHQNFINTSTSNIFKANLWSDAVVTQNYLGRIDNTKNQNLATTIGITNTTSNTAAQSNIELSSNSALFTIGKTSPLKSAFLGVNGGDGYLYNETRGDITVQNAYGSGGIKLIGGARTAADLTINATAGYTVIASRLGIGMTPTNIIDVLSSANAAQYIQISNQNASASAQAILATRSSSTLGYLASVNAANGGYGVQAASNTVLYSDNSIAIGADNGAGVIKFGTGTGIVERMRIDASGRVGIGQTTVTAFLHLKAGTTAASSSPLKFASGTNMTTPEAGSVEFDGTNYFVTSSTTRYTLAKTLTNTATLDFGSTIAGASTDLTLTITGAADGDAIMLGVPNGSTAANGIFTAWVSSANTITVRFTNSNLVTTLDPASGTFRASIVKY